MGIFYFINKNIEEIVSLLKPFRIVSDRQQSKEGLKTGNATFPEYNHGLNKN